MATFKLQVVTPDRMFFEGDAVSVIARTTEGDVCIMANHAPYVAALNIGKMVIKTETETRVCAISQGFIQVAKNEVRIVATTCEYADEIDVERAIRAKEEAERLLEDRAADDKLHKDMEIKLKKATNRIDLGVRK